MIETAKQNTKSTEYILPVTPKGKSEKTTMASTHSNTVDPRYLDLVYTE